MTERWENPITVSSGSVQREVDPDRLRPARPNLVRSRLEKQLQLQQANKDRFTLICVTANGVIVDGHHAVRAAAELGRKVEVFVTSISAAAVEESILSLTIRDL